ncbi:response regulator [Gorillibacterium sp. sgz5001074]|uniref:response regulator n=1 Tax=Gorillibacterium sp. sgz5001074 TaxID=3446695 RepID=UPI003F675781
MKRWRVLIADDHPLARRAVREMLEDEPEFVIAGEAANGEEAVRLCGELEPDLVLMDIRMPGLGGLEATRVMKQRRPGVKVVVLSVSDSVQDLFTAIQYGAQGYLLKSMDPADWLDYLHALLEEEPDGSRRLADKLFLRFKPAAGGETGGIGRRPEVEALEAYEPLLTARERQIAGWVAAGATNRQIAEELVISEHTVKNHMKNILEKLGMENRVQLAAFAIQMGWKNRMEDSE